MVPPLSANGEHVLYPGNRITRVSGDLCTDDIPTLDPRPSSPAGTLEVNYLGRLSSVRQCGGRGCCSDSKSFKFYETEESQGSC